MPVKFDIDKRERFAVVTATENTLPDTSASELQTVFQQLNKDGFRNIILNLKSLQSLDSAGFRALSEGNKLCSISGGTFVVAEPDSHVLNFIKLAQSDILFTVIPTLEESIDYIIMEELERDLFA